MMIFLQDPNRKEERFICAQMMSFNLISFDLKSFCCNDRMKNFYSTLDICCEGRGKNQNNKNQTKPVKNFLEQDSDQTRLNLIDQKLLTKNEIDYFSKKQTEMKVLSPKNPKNALDSKIWSGALPHSTCKFSQNSGGKIVLYIICITNVTKPLKAPLFAFKNNHLEWGLAPFHTIFIGKQGPKFRCHMNYKETFCYNEKTNKKPRQVAFDGVKKGT